MAKVDPPAQTKLERVSTWLPATLGLLAAAGVGYGLLSGPADRLSTFALGAIGVAVISYVVSLLTFYFTRENMQSTRAELNALTAEVTSQQLLQRLSLERTAAQTALSTTEALRAVREAIPTELIQSIVDTTLAQRDRDSLVSLETGELIHPLRERVPIRVTPPRVRVRTQDAEPFELRALEEIGPASTGEPIGKLKVLLDELADRDQIAMQASLELTKMITRGQPPNTCQYRVWFGTDRRPKVDGDYSRGFKEEFSDVLRYGSCVVQIPQSHEFASLGSSPIARIVKKLAGKPSDAPLKLMAIEAGTSDSFVNDLRESLRQLPESERDLALFLHGYNVDFESAAIRSAQVGRDLGLPGPMLFYSWPSKAKLSGYSADEATIDRTLMKFVRFLDLLVAIPELGALNVIAHSMGNRLFQRAMQLLSFRGQLSDKRFGHVILAAPDIDRETFREAAKDYAQLKVNSQRRTAVYFNKNDVAVGVSGWIHEEARLGTQGGAFASIDSILWIDSLFRLDWLGHAYFANAAPVLKDMKALLLENKTPAQRQPRLEPVPSDVPQYWELHA